MGGIDTGYENVRVHLDAIREHFEKNKILHVSQSYMSQRQGEPSVIINVDAEFIGAYLRDDKLIMMMRFDDTKVDQFHVDVAYEAIRNRTKKVITTMFPKLAVSDLGIHVVDSTGNLADIEFE